MSVLKQLKQNISKNKEYIIIKDKFISKLKNKYNNINKRIIFYIDKL